MVSGAATADGDSSVLPEMQKLRILLVDDHPSVRLAMRIQIDKANPRAEVSEASSETDALRQLKSPAADFDLVFLDLELPHSEQDAANPDIEVGKRTLAAIRDMDNGPPVVVMSAVSDSALIREMMDLGAATFVPKRASLDVAMEAINRAINGGVWLPPEFIGEDVSPTSKPITHTALGLTLRQFQILQLALTGRTPAKIATILGINATNVRHRMCELYDRFGASNQPSLQANFAKSGLTVGILKSLPPVK